MLDMKSCPFCGSEDLMVAQQDQKVENILFTWCKETDTIEDVHSDTTTWGKFMLNIEGRTVDKIEVMGYEVSTVFLGQNYNWLDRGKPILFETMVFELSTGQPLDYQVRYCTSIEARAGHAKAIAWLYEREKNELKD